MHTTRRMMNPELSHELARTAEMTGRIPTQSYCSLQENTQLAVMDEFYMENNTNGVCIVDQNSKKRSQISFIYAAHFTYISSVCCAVKYTKIKWYQMSAYGLHILLLIPFNMVNVFCQRMLTEDKKESKTQLFSLSTKADNDLSGSFKTEVKYYFA